MPFSFVVPVTDLSSIGRARREAMRAAEILRFDELRTAEVGIVATEAARNVLIHGAGGDLVFSGNPDTRNGSLQIIALDKGKGIQDISKALTDGFSTSGTPGTGLGAIRRMSTSFDLYSLPELGTIVVSEMGVISNDSLQTAGLALPTAGEKVCGDAWDIRFSGHRTALLLVDGLGHGQGAMEAADEARRVFSGYALESPLAILDDMHHALKKTRGAAGFVAIIDSAAHSIQWAGVGNIGATLFTPKIAKSLISYNGTLGHAYPRVQQFQHAWEPHSVFIAHSDGLLSRWDLSKYRGILARHSAVIAGVLLRDFRRQRDDASILVAKS
jgi:anti-sigma regulatory factor (Ser/Thr protein kinase)